MNSVSPSYPKTPQTVGQRSFDARGQQPENVSLVLQYLRIAMRWRFVIGGIVVACMLIGLVLTLLMTPKYTASTTVEISRESNKITDIQGVERDASIADQEFYQTQYGLLRSRSLAEKVAGQLKLSDDPSFFEMFGGAKKTPAFQLTNGQFSPAGRVERRGVAGEVLLKNLDVAPTRLSRLVDIRFTSPDAAFSAKVANAWSANFIDATLERRYQATAYARSFLEGRLTQLRQRLEESERQLVGYASAQRIINLPAAAGQNGERTEERSIVADDLATLNAALTQAIADRVQAQARYEQAGSAGASVEALRNDAINSMRQKRAELAAEYQKLMTQFEPEYPAAKSVKSQLDQIDASLAREERRVRGALESSYREAVERENQLQAKVNTLKSGYLDLRRRSIQYNIFQREVDTNRQLYESLLQRYKEVGIAGGVGVNNVAIVDPAEVPKRPSSPRLLLNLLAALVAGVGLGALAAFGLEQIDEAIADPAEVERRLGLPLLGSVPKLSRGTPMEALLDRKSSLVDAYLSVQTNLEFATDHGVPRSLAVTSTRPAEGKSTSALALATMLARAHRRVILVDGDMRSPSVHHLANVGHERGLSNFLTGTDDIAALTIEMADLGISAMTSGPIPPNAAELLTGTRLKTLIDRLLEQYDHVVIDSPPVMGLADAPLIASRVEGVVFAVESHGIRTSLVRTALSRLAASNARIIGGILTKFEVKKAHGYGYGYEYGYGYGRSEADASR